MPGRDNYIYREGTTANTRLLNTQRVRVFGYDAENSSGTGDFHQIGLVQSWNPSHSRSVEPHRGIGYGDQIAELGVGVTDLTASCSIMMLYLRDIMQVFGYKSGTSGFVRSLKHHRWPFDIKEEITIPEFINQDALVSQTGTGGADSIITIYEGCWMTDYTKAFSIGETATTQDTTVQITDVYANSEATGEFDDATNSNYEFSNLFGGSG